MWHYSWFRILTLILCLILAFLVGVSIKGEKCKDSVCSEPTLKSEGGKTMGRIYWLIGIAVLAGVVFVLAKK